MTTPLPQGGLPREGRRLLRAGVQHEDLCPATGKLLLHPREANWRAHRRNLEAAAWRAIRELVAEHNALIGAGKPGVAMGRNGNLIKSRLRLPARGNRAQKEREALVARPLASERPDTVARLQRAIEAMIADENARLSQL